MAVKMRPTPTRTKRPYGALLYPGPVLDILILSVGGSPDANRDNDETPLCKISQDSPIPSGNDGGDKVWWAVLLGRCPAKE